MKKIAIIGGGYLQLPLVNKAKEMGIETHCFAWEKGAVCKGASDYFYPISVVEKEAILKKCEEIGIDGILTIASDVAVLTVNYVAEKLGLVGNSDIYSQTMTNKYLMRQCFTSNGVPSPKYKKLDENTEIGADAFTFPVIVKPTDRSGSLGVEKVEKLENLSQAVKRACKNSFKGEAIIEEFVEGREISVETISYNGNHYILQITDKVTTEAPYFVELEHHQPTSLPTKTQEEVKEIVLKALDALNIRYGAAHSELKITSDSTIKVIEIGARMGGDFIGSHLVELSTGYDFLKGVIEVALGEFTKPIITKHMYSGVYFLCAETEYVLPYIEKANTLTEIVSSEITDPELHHIECSGDRSGYFIYNSKKRFNINKTPLPKA